MFRSIISTFIRHARKNYLFFLINVSGLVLGFFACMIIWRFAIYELSYDEFNERSKDIYRATLTIHENEEIKLQTAESYASTGPLLKAEFPEVDQFARLSTIRGELNITYNGKKFREVDNAYWSDASLFDVFSIPFVLGDPKTALNKPNQIVISSSLAKKIFGDEDPLNKFINVEPPLLDSAYLVAGVFEDIPENSHMKFDILVSNVNYMKESRFQGYWGQWVFYTYVLLKPGSDPDVILKRLPEVIDRTMHVGMPPEMKNRARFNLQPLKDIHMYSKLTYELYGHDADGGNGNTVWMLIVGAIFILIVASINYMNLSTAQGLNRAMEVGLRKLNGANQFHLVLQFVLEAVSVNLISIFISIGVMFLVLPQFGDLVGKDLAHFPISLEVEYWLVFFICLIAVIVISALYPASILSSFKPSLVLKGQVMRSKVGTSFFKGLVTVQVSLAVFFIFATLIVYQQLNYMQNKKLGIAIDRVIVARGPANKNEAAQQKVQVLIDQLKTFPTIVDVTHSSSTPGIDRMLHTTLGITLKGKLGGEETIVGSTYYINRVGLNYLPFLGSELIVGRGFVDSDWNRAVIVNETVVKTLGFTPEKILRETVRVGSLGEKEIVGVVKDFNQVSLKEHIGNYLYMPEKAAISSILVRTHTDNFRGTMDEISAAWKDVFGDEPFEYFFLDDHFMSQYDNEQILGKSLGFGSILAMVVAGLGLFGLATYTVIQRRKEIGVRKVLGANTWSIQLLFFRYFGSILLVAILVSVPLAYYAADRWLQSFAYRIDVSSLYIAITIVIVLFVIVVSISYKVFRVSSTLPVNSINRID